MIYYIFSFLLFFFSCSKQEKPNVFENQEEELELKYLAAEKFDSITIIYTDSALIKLKLFGEKLYRYENYYNNQKNITKVENGLILNMYEKDGSSSANLTSQDATIFDDQDVIEFKKDVKYNSGDGLELETELLLWDKAQGTILVPIEEKVKVVDNKKGSIIHGYGLESNGNFTIYKVTKVRGIIQIEQKKENTETIETKENTEND